MPGIARQFEPQITRSGGAPSKFRFTVYCSDCAKPDTYEVGPEQCRLIRRRLDSRVRRQYPIARMN